MLATATCVLGQQLKVTTDGMPSSFQKRRSCFVLRCCTAQCQRGRLFLRPRSAIRLPIVLADDVGQRSVVMVHCYAAAIVRERLLCSFLMEHRRSRLGVTQFVNVFARAD